MDVLLWIGSIVGDIAARVVLSGTTRSPQGSLDELARRFPRSRVLRAELVTWPGLEQHVAATVRFVVADRGGLSFRDPYGLEVLKIDSGVTSGLELVESGGATAVRAHVAGGDPVDFWIDDAEQSEGLDALRAALLRTP